MHEDTQSKINTIANAYKRYYKDEYEAVTRQIKMNREKMGNKFGDLSKKMDTVERPLTEVPETLIFLFQKALSDDEMAYYLSKDGTRWFGKSFPEFRLTHKI